MNIAKRRRVMIVGSLSVLINIFLFIFKYRIGIVNKSIAIEADAWHTLSDSFSSLIVIAGAWMAGRRENEKHPYGYGRLEEITSIVIGVLLGIVGFTFMKEGIAGLIHPVSHIYTLSSYIIMIVTILGKELLAQISIRIGRKHNSLSLVADGWHHRSDAISSLVVLAGLFGSSLYSGMDSLLGIAVAVMILFAAFGIIREASESILGKSCPEKLIGQINDLSRELTPDISDLHNFQLHSYGDYSEIIFHCRLPENIHLKRAHETVSILETAIWERMSIHPTIHTECKRK